VADPFAFAGAALGAAIQTGGVIGAAFIQSDAQKSIAKRQYNTSLANLVAQERIAIAQAEAAAQISRANTQAATDTFAAVAKWGAVAVVAYLLLGDS
jgi:hypothetical protein